MQYFHYVTHPPSPSSQYIIQTHSSFHPGNVSLLKASPGSLPTDLHLRRRENLAAMLWILNPAVSCCCCFSVVKSCPTLCNLMDYSIPGFPVLHYLPQFAQTHVHWVNDATQQPFHPLCLSKFIINTDIAPALGIGDVSSSSPKRNEDDIWRQELKRSFA